MHIMFHYRYSLRIWDNVKQWLGTVEVQPTQWAALDNVEDCWHHLVLRTGHRRKVMASLAMLVAWELWNERNTRVFRHTCSLPSVVLAKLNRRHTIGSQ
jgi:hypothetical protein